MYHNQLDKLLQVAVKEDFFEIMYNIHSVQRGHPGVNKLEDLIKDRYHNFPRRVITEFVHLCAICNLKATQQSQARIKPIRSEGFLARMQIDLSINYFIIY